MKQQLLHLFFLLFTAQLLLAQQFPVQVIPQTIPPRPVLLSDYANEASINDKVRVQFILNDLTELNREVRLKIFISGQGINAQSNDVVVGANPIFLEGGVTTTLGTRELAPYFSFQNLQGISPSVYGSALPEGPYSICFEVYDLFTGNKVSSKTCTNFVLFDNDPPLLNLPLNAAGIQEMNPLNIVFQWTPRHINVSNVQYELIISEIWDLNIDPQAAFLSSPPIFQTTTQQTTFIYDGLQPSLIPGKRYGWRVRAFATVGIEEIGLFTNNGFSEIYYFDYQTQCDAPLFPEVEELTNRSAKIAWQGNFDHLDYTLQYREKNASSDWYDVTTPREYATVNDLKAETTYEFKVRGNCTFGSYGETLVYELTTLSEAASAYQGCAIEPDPIQLENQEVLPELFINDQFTAGDFPVTVLQVDNATAPFSGGGYVVVPWLGDTKISVAFEGIQINTDMQLLSGNVETTYDADWGNVQFIDDVFEVFEGDNDLDNITVEFDIPSDNYEAYIEVNNDGTITITDPNTNVSITYPGGDDVQIVDNNPGGPNDIFIVDEDGNVTYGGTEAEGGALDTQNTPGFDLNGTITQLSAPGIKVLFNEDPQYKYGYDKVPEGQYSSLSSVYDRIQDAAGAPYDIIHKAVKKDNSETIRATVNTDNDSLYDRLLFKTETGRLIEHTRIGQSNVLDLEANGLFTFENELVYATLKADTTQANPQQTVAGTFRLWHLAEREANITVVRVNEAQLPANYEQGLTNIYGKAAINFTYAPVINFNITPEKYGGDTTLEVGESGMLSTYTAEQNQIISEFKASHSYDVNTYYLFVFGNDIQPNRPIDGFMPLRRQYGFIFNTPDNIPTEEGISNRVKLMAHELGHGIFGLEHPFTQFDPALEKQTDWVMDYADGTRLVHTDWAQMHNPGFNFYLFQDDEDGEFAGKYAITPDFKFVFIQDSKTLYHQNLTSGIDIISGTLPGFIANRGLDSEKKYTWNFTKNKYTNVNDDNDIYVVETKTTLSSNSKINLLYNLSSDCGRKAYITLTYGEASQTFQYLTSGASEFDKEEAINNLIASNTSKAEAVNCGGSEEATKDWNSIPLDCSLPENSNVVYEKTQIIENINLSVQTPAEVRDILRANYSACVFPLISISTRLAILDKLMTGDDEVWQFEKDLFIDDVFYLDNLILSTPISDRVTLLTHIKNDNYNWIQQLFNEANPNDVLNNDVDFSEITSLFLKLGKWAWDANKNSGFDLQKNQKQINLSGTIQNYYPGEQPFLIGTDNTAISYTINGLDYNIINTSVDVADGKVILKNKYTDSVGTDNYYSPYGGGYVTVYGDIFNYDESYNPFEPVTIITGNDNKFDLEVGKEYVVPAIYALSLQGTLEAEAKELMLRQIGNATLIVTGVLAAPFSGGTSLTAVAATITTAGVVVGTIDAYVTSEISAQRINPDSELYKTWNDFYTVYTLVEAGTNVTNLGVKSFTSLSKVNLSKGLLKLQNLTQSGSFIANQLDNFKAAAGGASIDVMQMTKLTNYFKVSAQLSARFKSAVAGTLLAINVSANNLPDVFTLTKTANQVEWVAKVSSGLTNLSQDAAMALTNNTSKITQNIAKQPTIKIKTSPSSAFQNGKVGTVLDNINDVDYIITSMSISQQIIHVISQMQGDNITQLYIYEENIDENDPNNKCEYCPDRPGNLFNSQLCEKLNTLVSNTNKSNAVHRLCLVPNLEEIVDELLTYEVEEQTLFLTDIQGQAGGACNSENELCINLASLTLARVKAWKVILSKALARKKNISLNLFERININNYTTLKDSLVIKLDSDKLIDFSSDYNPLTNSILSEINSNSRMVASWFYVSDLTGKREWTRTSLPLLRRMSSKSDQIMETVGSYYSIHQKPGSEGAPPFTHNGTPFDNLGHPNFQNEVPIMANGYGKIRYRPDELSGQSPLTGFGTDMTAANNWAFLQYNQNGQENFRKISGQCAIKDATSIYADSEGWVLCVWHHHEDGKTLIPVPIETHNRACENGSSHTGGATIIKSYTPIIGFFPSNN